MLMKRLNIIIVLVYAYEYSFTIRTTVLLLLLLLLLVLALLCRGRRSPPVRESRGKIPIMRFRTNDVSPSTMRHNVGHRYVQVPMRDESYARKR